MPRALAVAVLLPFAASAVAQNCARTSTGSVPLSELTGTYQGFAGGLWGAGLNAPPPAHRALGLLRASAIAPRDAGGTPSPGGRIVLLSIGMSNCTQEFSTWLPTSNADPNRAAAVTVVDGAQGGQTAAIIQDPTANFWTVVGQRLAAAGVTAAQGQAVWLKEADANPTAPFPVHAQTLQQELVQVARVLQTKYPNLQLCFLSSRTYGGYATSTLNPEPFAYESGFAVRWTIEQQIGGDPLLRADPALGPVAAPWLGWGPYLWADGTTPRADGLVWLCSDFVSDGTHPGTAGRQKVAGMLQQFFGNSEFATPWYVGPGSGTAAAFTLYGSGCPGTLGVPSMVANSRPTLGNLGFRIGCENLAAGQAAMALLSLAAANVPVAGPCVLLIDPLAGAQTVFATATASGRASIALPVPAQPVLAGLDVFAQWAVFDAGGTPFPGLPGLAASSGGQVHVGT
jgi:hypothetical protein